MRDIAAVPKERVEVARIIFEMVAQESLVRLFDQQVITMELSIDINADVFALLRRDARHSIQLIGERLRKNPAGGPFKDYVDASHSVQRFVLLKMNLEPAFAWPDLDVIECLHLATVR